ncbi:MAG: hypothetical protein AAF974_02755 [Cyanobacteria bacterium P01_E01_bin.34]
MNTSPAISNPSFGSPPSWYRVPSEIETLLSAAVACWDDTAHSEQLMLQAINHPDTTLEVLVSAYRYFFYKSNDGMARYLAMQVMERIKQAESLPDDWYTLKAILQDRLLCDPAIRLYLNAYTALGIMLARWGAVQSALEISARIQSIDPTNEFGAEFIQAVLSNEDEGE